MSRKKSTGINQIFLKYVVQNILGMIGISMYILADTFFISRSVGSNGITALNLVLPIYSCIFAIGMMIGVGSAIRFTIAKGMGDESADKYFSNAIIWATIIGAVFMIVGGLFPDRIVGIMGGDAVIRETGSSYTRIFMLFAPCFMWNHICNAFVRNDKAPSVAMAATLISSLFNIVMDYVFMFPLKMSMAGAALATALSPLLGVGVCCIHLLSKKSAVKFKWQMPSLKKLISSCQVGVSAFVGEISSGVITVVFNMIILSLAGNTGIAAYGVVANTALVAVAMFNGVAQGSQPLVSEYYGKGNWRNVRQIVVRGIETALILAGIMILVMYLFTTPIANIFNSEHNKELEDLAEHGLRLYFLGFIFAGINIVGTAVLSAVESAKWASIASILRGFVLIVLCAFIMSHLFGMTGVWLAFPAAEAMTMIVTLVGIGKSIEK